MKSSKLSMGEMQAEKILKIHHSHYKNTAIQELCETAGVLTIRHQTGCETCEEQQCNINKKMQTSYQQ